MIQSTRQSRAVGYLRRSTDRQEQSIPDQKHAVEQYCIEQGLRLTHCYTDDAISGTSTLGRRAFQQMIQDAQRPSRPFDCVVVYDVKRFGRIDNDEAGYYRHLLKTNGVEVRYVSENFTGDGTDDLLRPVKQWQARQESKDLSKVTIRGLLSKMNTPAPGSAPAPGLPAPGSGNDSGGDSGGGATSGGTPGVGGTSGGGVGGGGWWMGGVPPHGYDLRYQSVEGKFLLALRYMSDGSKQVIDEQGQLSRTLERGESLSISKRDRASLMPSDPKRVEVIERIFRMYAQEGRGFKAIAQALNADGVPTARGPQWARIYSGKWTDTTIRAILVNPIYTGDMVWNRRTDARFHRIQKGRAVERQDVHGARLVPNGESDWLVVRDAHPPLVSRRLFEQARQVREDRPSSIEQRGKDPRRKVGGNWSGKRSRFVLSGLLTCGRCGNRYQGLTRTKGKRRKDGTCSRSYVYGCGGYITKGNSVCKLGPVPQDKLEGAVIEAVLGFYQPYLRRDGRRKLAGAVRGQMGCEAGQIAEAKERVASEQTRLSGIINNLLDNITPTNRQHVDQRLDELSRDRQQLQTRQEELDRLELSQVEIQSVVAEAVQFLAALEMTLRQGLPQEKLVALRQCVQRVKVDAAEQVMEVSVFVVPAGSLSATEQMRVAVR